MSNYQLDDVIIFCGYQAKVVGIITSEGCYKLEWLDQSASKYKYVYHKIIDVDAFSELDTNHLKRTRLINILK